MNTKSRIILGVVLTSVSILTIRAYAKSTVETVEQIDIQKYAGKWYEIARLPMYFQRKCESDTTALYTLNHDNTIDVTNSCLDKNGKKNIAYGRAFSQNSENSKLKVSFLPSALRWVPFTKGDYWILRIDPDYKVALVGGPSNKYLWILSRTPELDETTYQSYLQTATQQGYDISKLIKTPHNLL